MEFKMSFVRTNDGVEIFYKDWGQGQPIVFHHGWPLSCDDWDTQMLFFVQHGYMAGRSAATTGTPKCCSSSSMAIA
jgi:pimeloyl-ACP methyl ester carboxylesterase